MTIPSDYTIPAVGSIDPYYDGRGIYCTYLVPDSSETLNWICTLPQGHWCDFHVAHDPTGLVLAVLIAEHPWHLKVQEGL